MIDCMQSFRVRIRGNTTVSSANGSIRTWGTLGQYFYSLSFAPNNGSSVYNIEGFKNVNIYGVHLNGGVKGSPTSANKCAVVNDWYFGIGIDGNYPLVSGSKGTPNDWDILTDGTGLNIFTLSKNTNLLRMDSPMTSVKKITFDVMSAQGVGAEFLNEVTLNYNLDFTFFYKYEGED